MNQATAGVPYRRRKILVEPGYQLKVAALVLFAILFYAGLLGFLLFYPLMLEFDAAGTPQQQLWIANQVLELHMRFWPGVLVVGVLVAIQSLFVTHRIVGPAYHLRRVMRELGEGKFGARAHLRRFDRLKDVEAALNALGESLQRREQTRAAELHKAVNTIKGGMEGLAVPAELRSAVEDIERLAAGAEATK
jgi:methyl-accepting chemotaxis protein